MDCPDASGARDARGVPSRIDVPPLAKQCSPPHPQLLSPRFWAEQQAADV